MLVSYAKKRVIPVVLAGVFFMGGMQQVHSASVTGSGAGSVERQSAVRVGPMQVLMTGRLGIGYLNGESTELVYNTDGSKASELTWTLENVIMMNAGFSVQPKAWLKLNADIWVAVNDGDNTMDDYDWRYTGTDWSDWSHHEDVPLDSGLMFDINLETPFYAARGTTFSAILGIKHETWSWDSYGGTYHYSSFGFRDTKGSFDADELGISYEQRWTSPYIGAGFVSNLNYWNFSGRIIYSPFVQGEDEDTHHMRDLYFEEDFDNTSMWGADFSATYLFSNTISLTGQLKYQTYDEAQGSTTATDLVTGLTYDFDGDAAGADNESFLLSLILLYHF